MTGLDINTAKPSNRADEMPGVEQSRHALGLSAAAIAMTGAFVFGFDDVSRQGLIWLLPAGSVAGLVAAAFSICGTRAKSQAWLAAGSLAIAAVSAIAFGIVSPQQAAIVAVAVAAGMAFGHLMPEPEPQTHTKAEHQNLNPGTAAGLLGGIIVECDQQSRVLASSSMNFRPDQMLIEVVHIADRPALLLALSAAVKTRQILKLRMQSETKPHFDETQITIQSGNGKLFLALQKVDMQLSGKSDATRELAHEFRTPLAAIIGLADAMSQSHTCTDDMRNTYPAMIASAGRSLIELTAAMLDDEADRQRTPDALLANVAEECLALLQPIAQQRSITLYNRLPVSLADKQINSGAMRQILTNLISNAVKFSPKGASIELSAAVAAHGWVLHISDNGDGMSPEDVARIGQKKFRGKTADGIAGYGLGLSIVKRLVQEIGASISFESRPLKGTKVSISFPNSTLVELSNFQSQANEKLASQNFPTISAGAKHAAA